MVCFSPMKQEDYTLGIHKPKHLANLITLGLGDSEAVSDSLLWNYCAVTSRLLFLWEDKKIKKKNKPLRFPNLDLAKRDLDKELAGTKVRDYMHMRPEKFMHAVNNEEVKHLEVCKFFGSEKSFRAVVTARVCTWMVSQGLKTTSDQRALIALVRNDV